MWSCDFVVDAQYQCIRNSAEFTKQGKCKTLKINNFVKNDIKYTKISTLNALIFAGPKFREFREGQFFGYFAGIKFREFRE